jgi:hypothetical protein
MQPRPRGSCARRAERPNWKNSRRHPRKSLSARSMAMRPRISSQRRTKSSAVGQQAESEIPQWHRVALEGIDRTNPSTQFTGPSADRPSAAFCRPIRADSHAFSIRGGISDSDPQGLGEMHTLAAGVGDLKRVLPNVKTRGTWGEVGLILVCHGPPAVRMRWFADGLRGGQAVSVQHSAVSFSDQLTVGLELREAQAQGPRTLTALLRRLKAES